MDIKILGSRCAVSDEYLKAVETVAKSLKLDFTIEKIEDEEEVKKYGVEVSCMYGYCPGCNFNHEDSKQKNTPALVVNEELLLYNQFPMDDVFVELLKKYVG